MPSAARMRGWGVLAADIIHEIRRWHCPMATSLRPLHLQILHTETTTSPSEQYFLQPRPVGSVKWCSLEQGLSPTAQQSANRSESGDLPAEPGARLHLYSLLVSTQYGSLVMRTPHEPCERATSQSSRCRSAAWLRHTTDDAGLALTFCLASPPALRVSLAELWGLEVGHRMQKSTPAIASVSGA